MKIFGGTASKYLAEKIAEELSIKLSTLEMHVFSDEEKRVRVIDRVVGEDCVVVQSACPNADKNYMELFFIVDALKRSGAKSVTAVVPYLGYQRQDHMFRKGEAVSLGIVIKAMEGAGVDKAITFDLHSIKIPELFHIPVVHLSALPLFAEKIREIFFAQGRSSKLVLVSPDMGGIRRIKILSEMLSKMSYATIEKNRDLTSGKILATKIHGVVKKRVIIVDDMISTGSTIVKACDLLEKKGAEEIIVFATHAVFVGHAPKILQKSVVERVYVTDTIDVSQEKLFPKLKVLSVAWMIAKEIKNSKSQAPNPK